jgi:hypothetical protein
MDIDSVSASSSSDSVCASERSSSCSELIHQDYERIVSEPIGAQWTTSIRLVKLFSADGETQIALTSVCLNVCSVWKEQMEQDQSAEIVEIHTHLSGMLLTWIAEYMAHKNGDDSYNHKMNPLVDKNKRAFEKAYISDLVHFDKLQYETTVGLTTLQHEQERVEGMIQNLVDIHRIPGYTPYTWPTLPSKIREKGDRISTMEVPLMYEPMRRRLERQAYRWKHKNVPYQLRTTSREMVFEVFETAKTLGMTGLMNVCASQINVWRASCSDGLSLMKDWCMTWGTRYERVACMEVVVMVYQLARMWRVHEVSLLVDEKSGGTREVEPIQSILM